MLDNIEELALSLSFLFRVSLYPTVLHDSGPQLNAIIEAEGVVPDYINGIRVTGNKTFNLLLALMANLSVGVKTLQISRQVFLEENLKPVGALEKLGTRAPYHLWRIHRRLSRQRQVQPCRKHHSCRWASH